MRLLIEVDDGDREFIKNTSRYGGTVRICSRGEQKEARIIGLTEPLAFTEVERNQFRAMYKITPVCEL